MPITICTVAVIYKALDRYYVFGVRYNPSPITPPLSLYINYEIDSLLNKARVILFEKKTSRLAEVDLFIPHSEIAKLEHHMPQSGFDYVKGRMIIDKKLIKAKIKYRGDFLYHWAWNKKSIRVKLSKKRLYKGLRKFNLQAPKRPEQLNNYLGLRLAKLLGLTAPQTQLVHLNINNNSQGIHVLIEQLEEATLRHNRLMPGDIYRGEIVGKDAFVDSGVRTLFDSASVWDKMAINNHYADDSIEPLIKLISLIQNKDEVDSQKQLSELLDMQAWAKFSLFETLTQSNHYRSDHNWRLYYDPWRQKIIPIVWDPMSWLVTTRPHEQSKAVHEVIESELHHALFNNGDFLQARSQAFQDFFQSGKDQDFLKLTDETVELMNREILMDPVIMPANPLVIKDEMQKLKKTIHHIFSDIRRYAFSIPDNNHYTLDKNRLTITIQNHLPIQRIRVDLTNPPDHVRHTSIQFSNDHGKKTIDVTGAVHLNGNTLIVDKVLPPDYGITNDAAGYFPYRLISSPVEYTLSFSQIDDKSIVAVYLDIGNGWEIIKQTEDLPRPQSLQILAKDGLQLFLDTGNGFNIDQSMPLSSVNTIADDIWTIEHKIPRNIKKIRVDRPAAADIGLSHINLRIKNKKVRLPASSVTLSMESNDNTVLTSPDHAPFFILNLEESIKTIVSDENELVFKLQFKINYPNERNQDRHRVHEKSQTKPIVYTAISEKPQGAPIIWSGRVEIKETTVINQPLILKPGTHLIMHDQTSLIIKNQLLASGTSDNPIKITASKQASMPWGVIVLFGQQANNSTLSHCELSGGSGFKGDLFEYTAMLSIHNVNNVSISHCVFSNNKITDDMVHAVYSELSIDNSSFINAFADALDIDISNVEIIDSLFLNSGNDALDLMTAEVTVVGSTFRHSGDKGMSVGENSRLLAIDNYISDNSIGIQAKDNSDALLFNQTIVNNQKAIDVYKKNWRYGSGGHISVAKSVIRDNDHAITTGKQSKVSLFDSYLDTPYSGKKIAMSLVDNKNVIATSNILFLDDLMDKRTKTMLDNAPAHVYGRIQTNLRGAYTAVRK